MQQRHDISERPSATSRRASTVNGRAVRAVPGPPTSELDFDDGTYRRFHLSTEDIEDSDRRVELWDGATETAFEVREPTSPHHERPSQRLATLAERISLVRGRPIQCFGTMSLKMPGRPGLPPDEGGADRVMEADQSLYLHPQRVQLIGPTAMVVGEHHYPDIVLEVDLTTDVRRNKLKLYEAWGFPELWVDVPEESPRRKRSRGTTIYVREESGFQVVDESQAFPGWSAADIHTALNEDLLSERTVAILERIGAKLGAAEGTGPDDDPLLRSQREQARQEVRLEELEFRTAFVRQLLTTRGIDVAENFPDDVPGFATAEPSVLATAALSCVDEHDFSNHVQLLTAQLRG